MSVRGLAQLECREVVERVTDFLGDALVPADRARIEQHLLVCPPCTMHVGQMKSTLGHLATLGSPPSANPDAALLSILKKRRP
jgi:hypothetical protein